VNPIYTSATDYNDKYQEYCDQLVASHLYLYYEETSSPSLISSKYDEKLIEFYQDNNLGYTIDDYNLLKYQNSDKYLLDDGSYPTSYLFIQIDESNYLENIYQRDDNLEIVYDSDGVPQYLDGQETKLNSFYSALVKNLANEFLATEEVNALATKISAALVLMYLISFIPAVLITYIMFPLIFKDGGTIGKKLLQMHIVDAKTGTNPRKIQTLTREVIFILINYVLGIFSYGIAMIISLGIIVFSAKRQSIHDILAKTYVVKSNTTMDTAEANIIEITYDDGKEEVEDMYYNEENDRVFPQKEIVSTQDTSNENQENDQSTNIEEK
jgi:uncharacterized RDD family membrane protein YckC